MIRADAEGQVLTFRFFRLGRRDRACRGEGGHDAHARRWPHEGRPGRDPDRGDTAYHGVGARGVDPGGREKILIRNSSE